MSILYSDAAVVYDYKQTGGRRVLGVDSRQQINPSTGLIPALGNSTTFILPKQGDALVANLALQTTVSAVAYSGGTPTYGRFVDGAGIWLIDRIELWNSGMMVDQKYADDIYQFLFQHHTAEELAFKETCLGFGTTTQRNTLGGAQQTFVLELDNYFSIFNLPLPISLFSRDWEIKIYWNSNANSLVETDATTSCSFSFVSCVLIPTYVTPNGKNRQLIQELEQQANGEGIIFYGEQTQRILRSWAGGATSQQFAMSDLGDMDVIYMNITDRSSVLPTGTTFGFNWENYAQLASYKLECAGRKIHGAEFDITDDFFKKVLLREYSFTGIQALKDMNIYSISYSDNLKDEFAENANEYSGSMSFKDKKDSILTVTYPSAPSGARNLTVNVWKVKRFILKNGILSELPTY